MLGGLGFYAVNLVGNGVLTSDRSKYSNVGYVLGNWGRVRINQFSIFRVFQLPTCKLVSVLIVRRLACLVARVLSRITIVVYRLSVERIYSVIRVLPSYRVLIRLPLCIQIQAGHQRIRLVCLGALPIGVPTGEGVVFTRRQPGIRIAERLIVGAGLGGVGKGFIFTEIRMVGNVDCNVLDVAVDMIAVVQMLDGVPYDLDVFSVEVLAQNSGGITVTSIGAVVFPVVLIEETEVCRRNQIFAFNAIALSLGITVYGIVFAVIVISNILAVLGQIAAYVAGYIVASGNAAVRSLIRQVVFWELVCAVLRLTTLRQKYEVLDIFLFRRPKPCEVD